jgi:hypothetical protein
MRACVCVCVRQQLCVSVCVVHKPPCPPAEVMYIESQMKGALQKFGVDVFPHMENNNSAQVQQHFTARGRDVCM